MAGRVRIAILWHMHQPIYRNFFDGTTVMPLAFLHATKDYYEMLRFLEGHDRIRVTFNLVPSLLDQLECYADGTAEDVFLDTLKKPVTELDEDEKAHLMAYLFIGDVRHMIVPLSRYYELFDKKERSPPFTPTGELFSDEELLDLEVLFLLAWTGTTIREEEPFVRSLLDRGSHFTQEEKQELLALLMKRTAGILEAYRKAQDQGRIEITTTPYYHPILPLLIDFESARAADRNIPIPVTCSSMAEEAGLQVDRALTRYKKVFGRPCTGMWPAEGAVSAETLAMLAARGVRYAASDESVLARSLAASGRDLADNPEALYRPYRIGGPDSEIAVFFRDQELSDLVGFTYQRMEASSAVDDFISRLHAIRDSLDHDDGVIPIILDGENAWEHYPDNGRDFLTGLYAALSDDPTLDVVTLSQALEGTDTEPLDSVVAGSWIGGRLATWVGHSEKNRAWELVCRARNDLFTRRETIPKWRWERSLDQLMAAQGSDWFWWFGDDHFTTLADRFDELFRLHLINVYRFADLPVPLELREPVKKPFARGYLADPTGTVEATIDGQVTDYFEWLSAGRFGLDFEQGSMHRSTSILNLLHFGFGQDTLFLRLDSDGNMSEILAGKRLVVEVLSGHRREITLEVGPNQSVKFDPDSDAGGVRAAVGRVVEISIPLSFIGASGGEEILMSFNLWRNGTPIERAPLFSLVKVIVPEDYDLDYWII
jgi:alpha-amylase/alpha-mannosidase (GH57 family)